MVIWVGSVTAESILFAAEEASRARKGRKRVPKAV